MKWDEHLQFLVQLEAENIAEEYRPGRAMNDVDEEMNAEIRQSFQALQDKMPVLLAAPQLLAALKAHIPWKNAGQPEKPPQGWGIWQDAIDAINKAEGRGE